MKSRVSGNELPTLAICPAAVCVGNERRSLARARGLGINALRVPVTGFGLTPQRLAGAFRLS